MWFTPTTVPHRVWVYAVLPLLQRHWPGWKRLIWLERWGVRDGQPWAEQRGYISDLELRADQFLQSIQQHGNLENRLHWVRTVTFKEDHARSGGSSALGNLALFGDAPCASISLPHHPSGSASTDQSTQAG